MNKLHTEEPKKAEPAKQVEAQKEPEKKEPKSSTEKPGLLNSLFGRK
jgi:hypothetical protein